MKSGRSVLLAVLAVSVSVLWAGSLAGQDRPAAADTAPERAVTVHPEARRAISELRSPYCPGLMLEVCPSPQAAELRDSIDALARAGLSADSIVERVLAEHGEEWRAVPRREGAGWWAWLLPPFALLLGLGVVAVLLARKRRARSAEGSFSEPDEADRERLDRALEELDRSEHPDW